MKSGQMDNLSSIERALGLTLPAGTGLVGTEHQDGRDDMLRAKFRTDNDVMVYVVDHGT